MKKIIITVIAVVGSFAVFAQGSTTIKKGMAAPEISLPGMADTTIHLSSFKGKVVLIDFWASWCMPCRKNNPELVKLYEKYKSQGFEIYGVSIDQKKADWLNAIQKDALTWTQVLDQKGWNAKSTYDYGLDGIPSSFLLDKDGKVKAIGLTGQTLEREIKKLL
jgi:peroxiredoxin